VIRRLFEDEMQAFVNHYWGYTFVIFISEKDCRNCVGLEKVISDALPDPNEIEIIIVNIDDDEIKIIQKYSLEYLPTVLLYKEGIIKDRLIGRHTVERYLKYLK